MQIALIDYGSGNLRSALKALERAALDRGQGDIVRLAKTPEEVLNADRIVLPGVGTFGDCKADLEKTPGLLEALENVVIEKKHPFLGICVGMQLLATRGLEHGEHKGLDWVAGDVFPLDINGFDGQTPLRVPHMGWNALSFRENAHPVLAGIPDRTMMYFVHSYHFRPANPAHYLAHVSYGTDLCAMVGHENIVGTQFHPEKSQGAGLHLLRNFLTWRP